MPMVSCPQCGKSGNIPEQFLGKKIKCKQCASTFVASQEPDASSVGPSQEPDASSVGPLIAALSDCKSPLGEAIPVLKAMGSLRNPQVVASITHLIEELGAAATVFQQMKDRSARSELSLLDLHLMPQAAKLSHRCHALFLMEIQCDLLKHLSKEQADQIDAKASRIPLGALLPHINNFSYLLTIVFKTLQQIEDGVQASSRQKRDPMLLEKLALDCGKKLVVKAIATLGVNEVPVI